MMGEWALTVSIFFSILVLNLRNCNGNLHFVASAVLQCAEPMLSEDNYHRQTTNGTPGGLSAQSEAVSSVSVSTVV